MISGRWPCENAFPKGMRRADYGGRMAYRRARCVQHLSNGLCADKASRAAFRRACARQASDYSFAAAWMHKAGITQSCGGLRADDYPRAFAATIEKAGAKSKRGRSIRRGTVCHIGYANKGEAQTSEFPTKDTAKPPTADRVTEASARRLGGIRSLPRLARIKRRAPSTACRSGGDEKRSPAAAELLRSGDP